MRCTQCDGFMVSDNLIDLRESYQPMWMRGWRCIACGNIVDPLILRHRAIQEQGVLQPSMRETSSLLYGGSAKSSA